MKRVETRLNFPSSFTAEFNTFRRKLRIDLGIQVPRTDSLSIPIKQKKLHSDKLELLPVRIGKIAERIAPMPVLVQLGAPFIFDGSEKSQLRIPLGGDCFRNIAEALLEFFDTEMDAPWRTREGLGYYLPIVDDLFPEWQYAALKVAESFPWPSEIALSSISVRLQTHKGWTDYSKTLLPDLCNQVC